jgi:TPR repeat protein
MGSLKPDTAESPCWASAYELFIHGEIEKAITMCESEPCAKDLKCQRFLGWRYYEKDDFEAALKWFEKAVEQEDADALFGMGSVYFVRHDFVAAAQYFERAEKKGYGRACHWLGHIYWLGLGVPQNDHTALGWYRHGAAQGYLVAERALIHMACIKGGVTARIWTFPWYIYMLIKAIVIALRDVHDPRLMDVPNAFAHNKPSSQRSLDK